LAVGLIALGLTTDGKFLYAVNNGSNYILGYTVNTATGGLTSMTTPFPTGTNPYDIVISP
jgi:6-phosphogluconolactonase (cycloisomerase 2 family)